MDGPADIQKYVEVIKRRKLHFILPAVTIFVLAIAAAFILPPVYKATATIQIEAQEIPQELVRSTVTGYVEERLQGISQSVLSYKNLRKIIEQFGLYQDQRDDKPIEKIVAEMRENINLDPITAEVRNQGSWRTVEATTAFTLSYEGEEPEKLAQVVNHLASLFLEENAKVREEKAHSTMEFLENQAAELRRVILDLEQEIAVYKEKHINELPELMQLNLQTMERLGREIDTKEEQIKTLINRKIYLEGELARLEPTVHMVDHEGKRFLTPEEELKVLRSSYLSLSASLSEHHPDVVSLKKRLAAMEKEVNAREDVRQHYNELREKENRLAHLLETYSEKYPDVVRLKREIRQLKHLIQNLSRKPTVLKVESVEPDNPAYINIQTQIMSTQLEIKRAREELRQTKEKFEDYQKRVENTPKVEQRYLDLKRSHANANARYEETMNRLLAAKEAKGLEESHKGERFTLLEPAINPEKPYKPNFLAILLLGVVLAGGSGLGFGAAAEYFDHSVHTPEALADISGQAVFATVPYWQTTEDRKRKFRRGLGFGVCTLGLVIVGLLLFHLFYKPLDILWLQIFDRLTVSF